MSFSQHKKFLFKAILLGLLLISTFAQDEFSNGAELSGDSESNQSGDNPERTILENADDSHDSPSQDDEANESSSENADESPEARNEKYGKEWKCVHDQIDHKPVFQDIEEDGLKEAQDGGRRLSGYSSFRTYGYYGLLSSSSSSIRNYVSEQLVPPILSYFESALKVKYPVSGTLSVSSNTACGENTPSVLKDGVKTDFFYMFKTQSANGNWVASSTACVLANGSKRPIVAMTTLNTNMMNVPSSGDILLHEKNVICIMHEVTHTLGFSNSLFGHFVDSNGNPRGNIIKSGSLDGSSMQIIDVEPLTSKLQSFFGCSNLKGAYMENGGSDATAGSHFERRQFAYEAMTSGNIYEMKFSQFTLAMLESSGWYVADYDYADPFFYGQGQGCSFLTGQCSANSFDEFCSSSSRACSFAGGSGGSCGTDSRSDNCKFVHPNINWHCSNSGAKSNSRLGSDEAYGIGLNSKCFTGTLKNGNAGSSTSFCFQYSCSGSGSNTVLNVEIGGKTVACTSAGSKTVSGYGGTLDCPDPMHFCATVGKKSCPRNCMGRGNCVNGGCNCYSGFKGEDCSMNA